MCVKLGEEYQALMFSVCGHGNPALPGGKIALVGWILMVSLRGLVPAMNLAVRWCLYIKASEDKVCVLRVEGRKRSAW